MAESNFVLSVVVVPNIHPAIFANQEEHTISCRRPASISEIRIMVLSPHDGSFEVFHPNFCRPVANREEVLWCGYASIDCVDGSKMPATFEAISGGDFNIFLGLLVSDENGAEFGANEVFGGLDERLRRMEWLLLLPSCTRGRWRR